MTEWVLFGLIGIPLISGVLAAAVASDRLRFALVAACALLVAAGGIWLVALSAQAEEAGRIWSYTVPGEFAGLGTLLELAILAVILGVALRIRNFWITVFAVLQMILAVSCHLWAGGTGEETFVLFRIDNLSRIMLLVTSVVGAAILVFSIGYMREHEHHKPEGAGSLGRFYFYFLSFLGFMVGLVVSNQLAYFSFFWEATTLCSYALIGQDGGEARRVNAVRALLINSFGGVALLLGIFLVKFYTGGETFQNLFEENGYTLLPAILLCLAAFTKSALFPFQSWLLGAMVAPTPVSAMLHAATMVKAGVYLVLRIVPGFYEDSGVMLIIAFAGALSFVGGALLACTQSNGKKVLAYSTISNLGLVIACAGIDSPLAYAAGLAIISFHAISKGLLFLCVGRIEQRIGSRDIEDMDGLLYKMPFTACVILLGMMSMLLPPFGMLLSKWLAIEATIRSPFLLVFMVMGCALTVFFWAKWIGRIQHTGYHEFLPKEEIAPSMRISLGALALMVLGTGLVTMLIYSDVFVPMSQAVYHGDLGLNWKALSEVSKFSAVVIFAGMALGFLFYYFLIWRRFKRRNVRLPFLCGENVTAANSGHDSREIRSYDFYSVGGKIEHSQVASYYFRGIISEPVATRVMNWIAFLIIVVLIGKTIAAM